MKGYNYSYMTSRGEKMPINASDADKYHSMGYSVMMEQKGFLESSLAKGIYVLATAALISCGVGAAMNDGNHQTEESRIQPEIERTSRVSGLELASK